MDLCLCGCGEPVNPGRKWLRGHASRGEAGQRPADAGRVTPLPSPGRIAEDFGILDPGAPASLPGGSADGAGEAGSPAHQPPPAEPVPSPDDQPPAHARRDWHKARTSKAKAPKLTAAVRDDIHAKIDFALELPGRLWQARDPVCGGAFIDQRPEISRSLAEIACRSPALAAWFAGSASGFMVYLDLGAALWPVSVAVMAHHVYHSLEAPENGSARPSGAYAGDYLA